MKTSQLALTRSVLLTLLTAAVFVCAPQAAAQDSPSAAPAEEISCSSNFGNPVQLDKKYWSFVPATTEEIASVQKSKPELSAGPFSGGKFAYDRVEVYLVQTKQGNDDSTEGTVSLYARATLNKKESWFKIARDKEAGMANYDFFDLTIGATEGGNPGGDAGENPDENSSARVSFAAKELNAPIFRVSWSRHEGGASVFAEVRKILLLDFRSSRPQIVAALQCVSAEGGGGCGVWDNGSAPTTTLACNWDSAKADFLCTSTATGDYTVPLMRRFYLESGAEAPYTVKEGDPPDLESLGSWSLLDRRLITKGADVPGLGQVSYLAQYSREDVRGTAMLFASRGRDSSEARFFAVIVDPEGPRLTLEILPQPLVDEARPVVGAEQVYSAPDLQASVVPAAIHPAEKFADDVRPTFQVKALEILPNVSVWQVTAKQGSSHEVVWVAAGRNPATGKLVFSAVRVATEVGVYAGCGDGSTKASAAVIERKAGSLDAMLDVEPSHKYDVDGKIADTGDQGEPVALCPMQIKLSWNNSVGFIRQESDPPCPDTTRARRVSISDMGEITTKPEDAKSSN
jgi:hypothetical protein